MRFIYFCFLTILLYSTSCKKNNSSPDDSVLWIGSYEGTDCEIKTTANGSSENDFVSVTVDITPYEGPQVLNEIDFNLQITFIYNTQDPVTRNLFAKITGERTLDILSWEMNEPDSNNGELYLIQYSNGEGVFSSESGNIRLNLDETRNYLDPVNTILDYTSTHELKLNL